MIALIFELMRRVERGQWEQNEGIDMGLKDISVPCIVLFLIGLMGWK